jgi:PHP family Zn ribbon phosphoesterase
VKEFFADLHIHTALSPCADREMTPRRIVEQALMQGLSMIAICDHNAAHNVAAVQAVAGPRLCVVAGMEVTTKEEVHTVGLFPDARAAEAAAAEFSPNLPLLSADQRGGEVQVVFDEDGEPVGYEPRLLSGSSGLELNAVIDLIKRHNGLAVAAHVDRPSFGIYGQLGFFPADAGFDAIEVTAYVGRSLWARQIEQLTLPVLSSSDAHFLSELGKSRTRLWSVEPNFNELVLAVRSQGGRGCRRA